jgi:hypothetical protein
VGVVVEVEVLLEGVQVAGGLEIDQLRTLLVDEVQPRLARRLLEVGPDDAFGLSLAEEPVGQGWAATEAAISSTVAASASERTSFSPWAAARSWNFWEVFP